mgnify:CR=1 FL=1
MLVVHGGSVTNANEGGADELRLTMADLGAIEGARTYEEFKLAAERSFLLARLREHDWNVAETARALEMPRYNLYKKIERHHLTRDDT